MNANFTTSLQTRLIAFAVAVLASTVVLGSTVAGMQPSAESTMQVIALDHVTVRATSTN
ncbi:MAG TPA: hypothetical protein PLE54_05220 [Burkholderiaceae bacterium]|nr:hypothetical protein [Burkholderiaceae bacterium]HQR69982.1 hypothetical protein [Burkholderiaceae bacterium]